MKMYNTLVAVGIALSLAGCGDPIKIYPNEVGFQIHASGIDDKEFQPGTYRLDFCFVDACPAIIRVQQSKAVHEVTVDRVFLPKSNVDLQEVKVAIQFRIKQKPSHRLLVAREVASEMAKDATSPDRERLITSEAIWNVYLGRIAPATVIDGLKVFTVDQTLSEVVKIGATVKDQVNASLIQHDSPVEVTELTFNNGIGNVPNEVITAKRKLYAVNEEQARQIKALTAGLKVETRRQAFQLVRVKNDKKNSADAGIPYGEYVNLKVLERFSDAAEHIANAAETAAQNKVPFAVGNMFPPATNEGGDKP